LCRNECRRSRRRAATDRRPDGFAVCAYRRPGAVCYRPRTIEHERGHGEHPIVGVTAEWLAYWNPDVFSGARKQSSQTTTRVDATDPNADVGWWICFRPFRPAAIWHRALLLTRRPHPGQCVRRPDCGG